MKLDVVKNAVTSRATRQILLGKKHSPTLMFAGGVVGVVASTVLACKATLKVDEVLEEYEEKRESIRTLRHEKYSEMDRKKDYAVVYVQNVARVGRLYAPSIAVGAVSIAALTGSHVVLTKRNVAMTAAYKAVEEGFAKYRERVVHEHGSEKDREYYRGISRRDVHDTKKGEVSTERYINPGGGPPSMYAKFFDQFNQNWSPNPEYNLLFLRCQQKYANDQLRARGHLFLNEVYDALGLDRTKAGAVVGWVWDRDRDNEVDFGIFDDEAMDRFLDFIRGDEGLWLDFNVDGTIYDKI